MSDWRWPHFTPDELRCKGTGELVVVEQFLDRLERVRVQLGKPMVITSGYRAPAYNAQVSTTGTEGPHTTGRAVDVAIAGVDAFAVVRLAVAMGFTGIGVSQRGDRGGRFIHLDDIDDWRIRPRIWSY